MKSFVIILSKRKNFCLKISFISNLGDSCGQVEPLLSSFDEPPLTAVPINSILGIRNEDERRILLEEDEEDDDEVQEVGINVINFPVIISLNNLLV